MKQLLFFALSFFYLNNSSSVPLFNAPDLGKTHFIVGMPPGKNTKQKEVAICQADDLTALLRCVDGSYKQAFFSPDDDLEDILIQLINSEQLSIKAAIFSFTNSDIAQALILAHHRGVEVEVVTDVTCIKDRFNKIDMLKRAGIKIFVYSPHNTSIYNNIMHNKFVLFGKNVGNKSLLWTGSFNFTKSAKLNNQENIIIVDEMHLIERYSKQFAILKQRLKGKESVKLAKNKKPTLRLYASNKRNRKYVNA